jgi:hypothetical protein
MRAGCYVYGDLYVPCLEGKRIYFRGFEFKTALEECAQYFIILHEELT